MIGRNLVIKRCRGYQTMLRTTHVSCTSRHGVPAGTEGLREQQAVLVGLSGPTVGPACCRVLVAHNALQTPTDAGVPEGRLFVRPLRTAICSVVLLLYHFTAVPGCTRLYHEVSFYLCVFSKLGVSSHDAKHTHLWPSSTTYEPGTGIYPRYSSIRHSVAVVGKAYTST